MPRTLIRALTAMAISLPTYGQQNEILGLWKSNEEKTLESMRSTPGIPEESRAHLEDNLFGRMYIEYTEEGAVVWFEDEEKPTEYEPFVVIEQTADYFLVEDIDALTEDKRRTKLHRSGDCYYLSVSKWSFKEYFCRVR